MRQSKLRLMTVTDSKPLLIIFPEMSFPSRRMRPEVGCKSPLRCCISVDLPEPVCPMIPKNSPLPTVRLSPSTALRWNGVPAE